MRKRAYWILLTAATMLVLVLLWKLDIPHWQRLDVDRLNAVFKF